MGTNYFIDYGNQKIHIGKKSAGWKFIFHENEELNLHTKKDWINFLKKRKIYDEYYRILSFKSFLEIIEDSQSNKLPQEFDKIDDMGFVFIKKTFS